MLILAGCDNFTEELFSGNFSGSVIDASTNAPIEGALVLIKYELYKKNSLIPVPMDHSHKGGCVWNTVAKTNSKGIFKIPPLPNVILKVNVKHEKVRGYIGYSVYKAGYISQHPTINKPYLDKPLTYEPRLQEFPNTKDDRRLNKLPVYKMIKDKLSPVERNHYLRWSTIGGVILCEDLPTLKPYYEAIYEEMKQLAIYDEKDDPYMSALYQKVYVDWKDE